MNQLHAASVAVVSAILFAVATCEAEELYFTDFENFPGGVGQWTGTDGWLGNNETDGVHGIDTDAAAALGKTAFLGYDQPATFFTQVYRPVPHDPVMSGEPIVQFSAVVGIQDSQTTAFRDHFYISFYNSEQQLLAALKFDNTVATFGIWENNGGSTETDTGASFANGVVYDLLITIDFANNRWSAQLGDAPLITGETFNTTGVKADLGLIAAEWLAGVIVSPADFRTGDNWMLLDFITVNAFEVAPFEINETTVNGSGNMVLKWTGEAGYAYQVEYSDDMKVWRSDLPDSQKAVLAYFEEEITFVDTSSRTGIRYYRVMRTKS